MDDKDKPEVVDALDQLAMSLKWDEEYTDEYKRRVIVDAIKFVYFGWQKGEFKETWRDRRQYLSGGKALQRCAPRIPKSSTRN